MKSIRLTYYVILLSLALIVGCSNYDVQYAAYQKNLEIYADYYKREEKPSFLLELDTDGKIKKIEYYTPKPSPHIPEYRPSHHPAWQLANVVTAGLFGVGLNGINAWQSVKNAQIYSDTIRSLNPKYTLLPDENTTTTSIINSYNDTESNTSTASNDNDTKTITNDNDITKYTLTDSHNMSIPVSISDSFNPVTTQDSNKPIYDSYNQTDSHAQTYTYPILNP